VIVARANRSATANVSNAPSALFLVRRNERVQLREMLTRSNLRSISNATTIRVSAGAVRRGHIPAANRHGSPLLACFHPSIERIFEERLLMRRNLEELRRMRRRHNGSATDVSSPEPTLEDVWKEYQPSPVDQDAEVTELVGLCLWGTFSDNHEVVAADGRLADIGSFRGAGAFIDEHLTRDRDGWREGDYMRFYMGTIWIRQRADLAPVYAMIFSRLTAVGADWVYHFPELGIVELRSREDDLTPFAPAYSVSQSAVAELNAQHRRAEVQKLRAELEGMNARAREEAMDREAPATRARLPPGVRR
jgi:hypothetical protein